MSKSKSKTEAAKPATKKSQVEAMLREGRRVRRSNR